MLSDEWISKTGSMFKNNRATQGVERINRFQKALASLQAPENVTLHVNFINNEYNNFNNTINYER